MAYNTAIENVFISAVQDQRRKKKNGCYPVKIRVHSLQISRYYPMFDLTPDEWKAINNRGKKTEHILKLKKDVDESFDRMKTTVTNLINKEGFSFEALDRTLSRGTRDSILSAFEDKAANLRKEGKIATAVLYECAMNSIKDYAKKDLKFAQITPDWLKGYAHYLTKEKEVVLSATTVSMYMRSLRSIINSGLGRIITPAQYPFKLKSNKDGYQIPMERGRKMALSAAQVTKLINHEVPAHFEQWRDLWLFSFHCAGVNFNDLLRFRYKNIVNGYFEWNRVKTESTDPDKTKIRARITDDMADIIERWGNKPQKPDTFIFPFLNDKMNPEEQYKTIKNVVRLTNKKMKKLSEDLGLPTTSTYSARHSFVNIARRNETSVYVISKLLGHKSTKTTDFYLDSLSDDEIEDVATALPRKSNGKKN